MSTVQWSGKDIYLFLADDRTALDLRTAKEGDNPQGVFKPDQLEDLYATIAASGFPVKSQNFVLYGEERGDGGRPKAIPAAVKAKYFVKDSDGNKTAEQRETNYAYTHEQIDKFVPVSFALKTKFIKVRGNRNVPVPLFMAYATPYERTASEQAAGFQRVTAAKVAPTSQPETVARQTGKKR